MNGWLDRNDSNAMQALHYVYLPRINRCLRSFKEAWNRHPVRTEHNWTPSRMWLNGISDVRNRHLATVQDIINDDEVLSSDDLEWYGYDPNAPAARDGSETQVEVYDLDGMPVELLEIISTVEPLQESENLGVDLYMDVKRKIEDYYAQNDI